MDEPPKGSQSPTMPWLKRFAGGIKFPVEFVLLLFALGIAFSSQWPALSRPDVMSDDVRQHIFWMHQFRDPALFQNDLLTLYSKNFQPWGFVAVYWLFSFFADPFLLSKLLPFGLLLVSVFYLYRLVRDLAGTFAGVVAALMFTVNPVFFMRMTGGLSRGFAYPLMIAFLYYLVRRDYLKTAAVFVLQCLFYPVALPVCLLTYALSFFGIQGRRPAFFWDRKKAVCFAVSGILCFGLLGAKYLCERHPEIGEVMSGDQVVRNPDFYVEGGRDAFLPLEPVWKTIAREAAEGVLTPLVHYNYYKAVGGDPVAGYALAEKIKKIFIAILMAFWLFEILRGRTRLPAVLFLFFLSSVLMYQIAAAVVLKLYFPARYIEYPVKLLMLIFFVLGVTHGLSKIRPGWGRTAGQAVLIVFVLLHSGMNARNTNLMSMIKAAPVYDFIRRLPKDSMIAAHPFLADGIPYFTDRKTFIMLKLSNPMYSKYWETIKKRTYGFFDAYYSPDPMAIYQFLLDNGIDFVVVNRMHFILPYFLGNDFYFEPFNAYIAKIVRRTNHYAMVEVPPTLTLFNYNEYFIVHRDVYKKIALAKQAQAALEASKTRVDNPPASPKPEAERG